MIYSANDEGVAALNRLGTCLPEYVSAISDEAERLLAVADEHADLLGVHVGDLRNALGSIQQETRDAAEPIEELSEKTLDTADGYQEVIDRKRFSAGGSGASGAAGGTGGAGVLGGAAAGAMAGAGAGAAGTAGGMDTGEAADTAPQSTCLNVSMTGSIPQGYEAVVSSRHDSADPTVCSVFDRFAGELTVQNANYPADQTAHYSPSDTSEHPRGVYYNAEADLTNPRGPGSTYYHELGHMIDNAATGYQGDLSNTPEFREALMEDGRNILAIYESMTDEQKENFVSFISQDSAHSASDLIDAVTGGQLYGRYGHPREYWQRPGNLQAEAFAHFFEASMGGGAKRDLLSNLFPTAFGRFTEMIESLVPHVPKLTLHR